MRISPKEAKILLNAHLDADISVTQLARKVGTKSHAVHYTINKFREAGIIREWPLINFFHCGLEQHIIYFSLTGHSKRAKIIDWLSNHPRVIWFAELGGDLNYGLTLLAQNAEQAALFLDQFVGIFGNHFSQLKTAIQLELSFLRKSYLVPGTKRKPSDCITVKKTLEYKAEALDDFDWEILKAIHNSKLLSNRDIANYLEKPRATIDKRIQRLKQRDIIVKRIFHIRANILGFQVHRLLIKTHGPEPRLRPDFLRFALSEPSVVSFFRCFGSWEYELVLETPSAREVVEFRERLFEAFRETLAGVEILPIFSQTTSKRFLDDSVSTYR